MTSDKQRALNIVKTLKEYYPDADCTLQFSNHWQLLIAAILAAQCTDERVNIVTEKLFVKYPDLEAFALAKQEEMESDIRTCGLFRNKARAIIACCKVLIQEHNGQVPDKMEELLKLPGIGRKIANLILGESFAIPAVVVDTHCARITNLLGLTTHKEPEKIEKDLIKLLPSEWWTAWGHLMVAHGRNICKARQKQCHICPVGDLCAYNTAVIDDGRTAKGRKNEQH